MTPQQRDLQVAQAGHTLLAKMISFEPWPVRRCISPRRCNSFVLSVLVRSAQEQLHTRRISPPRVLPGGCLEEALQLAVATAWAYHTCPNPHRRRPPRSPVQACAAAVQMRKSHSSTSGVLCLYRTCRDAQRERGNIYMDGKSELSRITTSATLTSLLSTSLTTQD